MFWLRLCLAGGLAFWAVPSGGAAATDYARAQHVNDWLRHPVYGDPSFDAFDRLPGNPIHRGQPPFEWPVNGFFFPDPRSQHWYLFIGDYGKGYLKPPSRCVLYRSSDHGHSWTNLGVVLQGNPQLFDHGGHTPDVSVVYSAGRYHMVYDWGEPDFNAEGGLAYAWAERPDGPWHRAPEPITRNSTLPRILGRYQRTYAATLIKRTNDWLILGMMDRAPHSWALFAITAGKPEGPYSERRLVRHVEADYFHPPLLEFFPAFVYGGYVYAPATSVALNRNFNALFRAPVECAEDPSAWALNQHGSLWHAEDTEAEHYGIWGQTFSGLVQEDGMLRVMFPSRDANGCGTINLAQRRWAEPLRKQGFVLSGQSGPSLTLLRRAYADFELDAALRLHGTARLLMNYNAPLGPDAPSSDSTLHPLSNTRHLGLELSRSQWSLTRYDALGNGRELASGRLEDRLRRILRLKRSNGQLAIKIDGSEVWVGPAPAEEGASRTGLLGFRVEAHSHLTVDKFLLRGRTVPASVVLLHTEALLGAGASPGEWTQNTGADFRFGTGSVSKIAGTRAKWNVIGTDFKLWSPRGPGYGKIELRVDGTPAATIDLHSEQPQGSGVVWSTARLPHTFHAIVLVVKSGHAPLDCLEVGVTPDGLPRAAQPRAITGGFQ
ncbi:MAG TPA: hypothetical protein VJA21_21175 [Verrucomicrobiae bacterium]